MNLLLGISRGLIAGFILGTVITSGVFLFSPIEVSKSGSWQWANWIGVGEDKLVTKATERSSGESGAIQKVIFTEVPQPGKTLWDFLGLSGSLAVPFLLFYLGSQIQKKDKEIAEINLREEALQRFLDRVSELLTINQVNSLDPSDPLLELIKDIVQTRTLTILRSLGEDGERKGSVIKFLVEADLINSYFINSYFKLDLSSANLSGANLSDTDLSRANLDNANLSNANLSNTDLSNASLSSANLSNANLSNTDLTSTKFYSANLSNANLSNAELTNAKLNDANFKGATLRGATGIKNDQITVALNLRFPPYSFFEVCLEKIGLGDVHKFHK